MIYHSHPTGYWKIRRQIAQDLESKKQVLGGWLHGPQIVFTVILAMFCQPEKTSKSATMFATMAHKKQGRLKAALEHASGDKRFKILEVHMKKHLFRQDALIEVLHKAQELFGFLEDDLLLFIASKLKLPPSRVYGVATFYHFFTLKPQGEHSAIR